MNVLIIPEDCRKDEHILRPIIGAMMKALKKKANIQVCTDPILGGVDQALRWERISEIVEMYKGMVKLFLLCVDRDGKPGRRKALDGIEKNAAKELGESKVLLAENAWQELEVWILAGHSLSAEWDWKTIRAEEHPKEAFYLPFAEERGVLDHPWEGRKTLAREAAANYKRIRNRCPEDVAALEERILEWLRAN